MDLDGFKPINDRYGHQAGDACLRHFVETCLSNIRKGDWVARWGGDEFVLTLWEEKGRHIESPVLERIATDLAENPVQLEQGDRIQLTFSAGVVQCTGSEGTELGVSGVFALADKALYEAKKERNKSTFVFAS